MNKTSHWHLVVIPILIMVILAITGCGEKTVLTKVPIWAENSLMTADGRLFVTGFLNLYEITKNDDGAFQSHELYPSQHMFMGVDQRGEYLYAIINGNGPQEKFIVIANLRDLHLSATQNDENNVFTTISLADHNLPEFGDETFLLPNGMSIAENGYIYITDEQAGRIMRFHISDNDPTAIENLEVWIDEGADSPNGIDIKGDTIYFSECFGGDVKKVTIQADGSSGDIQIIHSRPAPSLSIMDDLAFFQNGILVTSCSGGLVFHVTDPEGVDEKGEVIFSTTPETFLIATSVCVGKPPMFESDDLIVTEGGGGQVSVVKYEIE